MVETKEYELKVKVKVNPGPEGMGIGSISGETVGKCTPLALLFAIRLLCDTSVKGFATVTDPDEELADIMKDISMLLSDIMHRKWGCLTSEGNEYYEIKEKQE